jgi:hypothetical protein
VVPSLRIWPNRNHEVAISESLHLRFPIGCLPQFLERCGLADRRIAPGLDVMAGHPVQPAVELRIREIQMFGNAQEMQIGSVDDDGGGYGDATPPRLRMSAKRPLADFRRSGGKSPIVNVTVDASRRVRRCREAFPPSPIGSLAA